MDTEEEDEENEEEYSDDDDMSWKVESIYIKVLMGVTIIVIIINCHPGSSLCCQMPGSYY